MTGYRFVSSHEDLYPIEKLCENVGVSRSGYYAGAARVVSHDSLLVSAPSRATTDREGGAPQERPQGEALSIPPKAEAV